MKPRDRVICIDDKGQRRLGLTPTIPVVFNQEYVIQRVVCHGQEVEVKGASSGHGSGFWIHRFRKIETHTATVNEVKFEEIDEKLEIVEPEKIEARWKR